MRYPVTTLGSRRGSIGRGLVVAASQSGTMWAVYLRVIGKHVDGNARAVFIDCSEVRVGGGVGVVDDFVGERRRWRIDHGIQGRTGKHTPKSEEQLRLSGLRVPLVMYGKGIIDKPEVLNKVASQVDVLSTVASNPST